MSRRRKEDMFRDPELRPRAIAAARMAGQMGKPELFWHFFDQVVDDGLSPGRHVRRRKSKPFGGVVK